VRVCSFVAVFALMLLIAVGQAQAIATYFGTPGNAA
jgi:hypothetical protein